MESLTFKPVDASNWEAVIALSVHPHQKEFVPSPAESLAACYIKPWDPAMDGYGIYSGEELVGMFTLSYTPGSPDNYWIGGFMIDARFQGRGFGRQALKQMLRWIPARHPACRELKLTVEKTNLAAQALYKSLGFSDTGETNAYGEIVFSLTISPDSVQ